MRDIVLKIASISISFILIAVVFELGLRLMPYNSGMVASHVDETQPVYRFLANRDFQYSQDWDMKNARVRHINNDGFVSDVDYRVDDTRPLVAVIGDSFVEAVHVDWAQSVHGQLHDAMQPKARVYAFGAASAGLAQYLAWAEYARDTYKPQKLVVSIIGNDFLQSLIEPGAAVMGGFAGMTYFTTDGKGGLALMRSDRGRDSFIKSILRKSALVNYLYRNMQVTAIKRKIVNLLEDVRGDEKTEKYVAYTYAATSDDDIALAKSQIDMFLRILPAMSGLAPQDIVLTIDGLRPDVYDDEEFAAVQDSFPAKMGRYLVEKGTARNYEVIDLNPYFIQRHKETAQLFEFPYNGHWNANGHTVMADAVLQSRTMRQFFSKMNLAPVAQ